MMKERYVKPAIYMESFALSQTIARNCGDTHDPDSTLGESTHYNEKTCTWDLGGSWNIFYGHCMDDWSSMDEASMNAILTEMGICYNNPDGSKTIFSST